MNSFFSVSKPNSLDSLLWSWLFRSTMLLFPEQQGKADHGEQVVCFPLPSRSRFLCQAPFFGGKFPSCWLMGKQRSKKTLPLQSCSAVLLGGGELQPCSARFALFCCSYFGVFCCASAIWSLAEMHLMRGDCQNKIHTVNAAGLQIPLFQ